MKSQDSAPVETGDRGLFDFTKKKDEEKISSEFEEKVMVSETNQENQHKLHRSHSSSSSSSEEEGCEDEEKKKKKEEKKSIKDKIKEKLPGDHKQDTEVPIEKIHVEEEEEVYSEASQDKLPGHQGGDVVATPPTTPATVVEGAAAQEEKKGFLEKIKDKIPGFHSKTTTTTSEEKAKE